jgi:taurine--2-oxoglutarate transaminase
MSDFNSPLADPMKDVAEILRERGMSTFVRWNWIFCCPPLIVDDGQIQEGLEIIDEALTGADLHLAA